MIDSSKFSEKDQGLLKLISSIDTAEKRIGILLKQTTSQENGPKMRSPTRRVIIKDDIFETNKIL